MIGGPNQSHKVNFKELPQRGKISSKNFCVSSVNTLFENIRKIPAEEQLLAVLDSSHHPAFADSPRIEGEGGTCEVAEPLQDLSVTQILPSINPLRDNGLEEFFCAKKSAAIGSQKASRRPAAAAALKTYPSPNYIGPTAPFGAPAASGVRRRREALRIGHGPDPRSPRLPNGQPEASTGGRTRASRGS